MMNKIALTTIICLPLITLSSCKKSSSGPNGGGSSNTTIMQPSSVSFYEGSNSAYPTVWDYTYDKDNLLIKYGKKDVWVKNIGPHGQSLIANSTSGVYTTSYLYSIRVGLDQALDAGLPVNIYTEAPTKLEVDESFTPYSPPLVGYTKPAGYYLMTVNKQYQLLGMFYSNGYNIGYHYDTKGNLASVNFFHASDVTNVPSSTLVVDSVDDKHSPFSAVKGYYLIAWPVGYADEYALAYCKNNPLRITEKNRDSGTLKIYRITTFQYEYNEAGYPTKIVVKSDYPNLAVPSTTYKTYNYTYTKLK